MSSSFAQPCAHAKDPTIGNNPKKSGVLDLLANTNNSNVFICNFEFFPFAIDHHIVYKVLVNLIVHHTVDKGVDFVRLSLDKMPDFPPPLDLMFLAPASHHSCRM